MSTALVIALSFAVGGILAWMVLIARLWLWIGASAFVIATLALLWAYHQRYQVISAPGVLR